MKATVNGQAVKGWLGPEIPAGGRWLFVNDSKGRGSYPIARFDGNFIAEIEKQPQVRVGTNEEIAKAFQAIM